MNGQEVLAMGSPADRELGRRSPPDLHSLTKNTPLGHNDRDFLQQDTRAAALGMQSYGRSYFCLLNVIFGCVNRNFGTNFDPVLPEPNRIFGLLNLSNKLSCSDSDSDSDSDLSI